MRRIFLGDLHGNWQATQSLAALLPGLRADETWFMGDAVGKGPDSVLTCDWVREHCDRFIGGNWDYGIGGREYAEDGYFWDRLGEERLRWLNGLPREAELEIAGIPFRLFHGRPVTELLRVQDDRDRLEAPFRDGERRWGGVIFADSHRPFFRTLTGYIANTGSVGNSMGVPKAHALVVDELPGGALSMAILCVPYDNEAAAEAARRETELPHRAEYIREVLTGVYARG